MQVWGWCYVAGCDRQHGLLSGCSRTLGSTQLQHSTISHLLGNNVNKCDYWCGSFYYLFSPHREAATGAGAGKHTQNTDRGDPPSHGHWTPARNNTTREPLTEVFTNSKSWGALKILLHPFSVGGGAQLFFLPKLVLLWQLSRGGCLIILHFRPEIPACSDSISSFLLWQAILFFYLFWCFRCVLDILCACL